MSFDRFVAEFYDHSFLRIISFFFVRFDAVRAPLVCGDCDCFNIFHVILLYIFKRKLFPFELPSVAGSSNEMMAEWGNLKQLRSVQYTMREQVGATQCHLACTRLSCFALSDEHFVIFSGSTL